MQKNKLGTTLRYYRKRQRLSVEQLAERLQEQDMHVSCKTIYSWENGTNEPRIGTFFVLCQILHIENPLEVLGYRDAEDETALSLSKKERKLILHYRSAPQMQAAVDRLLDLSQ